MKRDPYIESLVDVAMSVFAFDDDWDNESIPEVKYNRDQLRRKFEKVFHPKTVSVRKAKEAPCRAS